MYIDHQVAQKIVDRIMKIIGYNVNVMNNQAIIVGSGELNRINLLHEGALQVLQARSELNLYEKQTEILIGVKEGINLPITNEGEIIGVVGITGKPEDVNKYADLVVMTAELIIEQTILAAQVRWDMRLKESIIMRLISGGLKSDSLFLERIERMEINLDTPRVAVILTLNSIHSGHDIPQSVIYNILYHIEKNEKNTLLAVTCPTQIVILKKITIINKTWCYSQTKKQLEKYQSFLTNQNDIKFKISMGQFFPGVDGFSKSYKSALKTLEVGILSCPYGIIYSARDVLLDLILKETSDSWTGSQLLVEYETIISSNAILKKTLQAYFLCNTDLVQTAAVLHIHVNTLRYRLDKVSRLLGIDLRNIQDLFCLYISSKLSQWSSS